MCMLRFLATALIAAVGVVPLTAQGPSAVVSVSSAPAAKAAPQDLSSPDPLPEVTVHHTGQGSFSFEVRPRANTKLDPDAMKKLLANQQVLAMMMKSSTLCYSMEDYRFTRPDPTSDTMKLTGKSTCQPSTQFQSKSIVVKPGSIPAH